MPVNVEELYRKYGPMVLRRCRFLLKNEEMAYDAMQDVFLQVVRRQKELHADAPSSLLYTIATNTCLNIIRSSRKRVQKEMSDSIVEIATFDDFEKRFIAADMLDSIFENEKETTRTIAMLHYVDRFTLDETADMVNMSVSGVRKRLRKLREGGLALKEAM